MEKYPMIQIDGSYGEGGGQILRTSLALSAILRKPFLIHHIRSKRKNPGLQAQHLKAIEAVAEITEAQVEGVRLGSQEVTFFPQKIIPGEYQFDIKTAGSITLLLQALLPPLCLAKKPSKLTLVGGTHVPWSPPFHYFSEVFLPALYRIGISIEAKLERWGFYPKGGGRIEIEIPPTPSWGPISLISRGALRKIRGLSAVARLPKHIAERQKEEALKRIYQELKEEAEITVLEEVPSSSPGSFFFLRAEFEEIVVGFSSLGEKGKPAERVADEALDHLIQYMRSEGCLDPYLSDQLVLWMALIKGRSSFTTTCITEHLLTNLWVIKQFLGVKINRKGEKGEIGEIEFINE
ncbi:MAG: RNA 3'-terminal phosphate cyclase [Thermodesulfobacteriota bacterium]